MATAISIGNDHAGFDLKLAVAQHLRSLGHAVDDLGSHDHSPVDYPDYALRVGLAVLQGGGRGILICGSGIGAAVAADKLPGIRAGVVHDCYSAHQGVEHDDMNILVLGARVIGTNLAKDLATVFLAARFSGEPRHRRRLAKIAAIEATWAAGGRFEPATL